MAVLKDLIVHGNSRFLNVAQFKDLIADTGRFQKLTTNVLGEAGQTISVYGIMNVEGELNTKSWTNANIATIGGNMYICPTISIAEGSTGIVTVGSGTLTFSPPSGSSFALDNLLGGDSNTSSWTQNSLVLVTGEILYNNEYLPMGTLKGKIGSGVSTSNFPITNVTNNKSTGTTADIFNLIPAGSYTYRNLKISIYEVYTSSKLYPLGIYFTAMGSNGRTFIDIYGGNKDTSTATSGAGNLAEPNVRIGNLKGLPQIMSTYTPSGWGIYTNNGYFTGTVVAKQGKIGDPSALGQSGQLWTIGNDNATGNAMIYSGTTGIGKDTNIYISSGVSSTQNIADSGTSSKTWAYTAGTNFGVTTSGTLYAKNAQISGLVASTNGFTVTSAATNGITLASMTTNGITLGDTTAANNKFNILITDSAVNSKGPGILLRQGTNVLNEITGDGIKIYLPTDQTNSIASFTADGTQIGQIGESHLKMDYHSLQMIDKEGNSYFYISDLRNENNYLTEYFSGDGETTEFYTTVNISSMNLFIDNVSIESNSFSFQGNEITINNAPANNTNIKVVYIPNASPNLLKSYTLGLRKPNMTLGPLSTAIGYNVQASGQYSFVEGLDSEARGYCCHAEGNNAIADGDTCHAEGGSKIYGGFYNHGESASTIYGGHGNHAENGTIIIRSNNNVSEPSYAHAEGYHTIVSGEGAHVEGYAQEYCPCRKRSGHYELDYTYAPTILWAVGKGSHVGGCIEADTNLDSNSAFSYIQSIGKGSTATGYIYAKYKLASASTPRSPDAQINAGGMGSHAEGCIYDETGQALRFIRAQGAGAHAEGFVGRDGRICADGIGSHAEGYSADGILSASNRGAHAEGINTISSGEGAHAEGTETHAFGSYSHAGGLGTVAMGMSNTAIGKFNSNNNMDDYPLMIGNGTDDNNRSNALIIDWSGHIIGQGMAGMVQMFAGSTAPTGWLICNGAAVSRTTYATLFAVIGTTYGAGDGSTTFNLPDLRSRMPIGAGQGSGLTNRTLGASGGNEYIQQHQHSFTNPSVSGGAHTHQLNIANSKAATSSSGVDRPIAYASSGTHGYTSSSVAHNHTVSGGAVGNVSGATTGTAGNMPPFIGINFIICTGKTS